MIQSHWRRIGGLHMSADGQLAAVWLAHDKDTDTIHLYDACVFKREVPAVIAEGINARGRWIPIAWEKDSKELAENLLDRGCNTLPESDAVKDTEQMAEITSRDIQERMRSGRFKVEKRNKEWLDEFDSFQRQDTKVPRDSHPLMAATRHAMASLNWAKRQSSNKKAQKASPDLAII